MAIIQAGQMINRKCRPYNLALPSLIISEETICVAVKCQLIISTYFIATAAVLRGRPAARFLGPALAHDLFDHRPQLVLPLLLRLLQVLLLLEGEGRLLHHLHVLHLG